jgi:2-C-methyl-D-erythritol 4-phosphate cytidylyltransferase
MGMATPKQYLRLGQRTVLEHALAALEAEPRIQGVVVVTGAGEPTADRLRGANESRPVLRATGGSERADSVLNGLERLAGRVGPDAWVLVHDAARPCLRREDLGRLIDTLAEDPVGGLLGTPVRDTMKRADAEGRVETTVPREGLWHALTPQMFRLGLLQEAVRRAVAAGERVTDEASAMERAGHRPRLVEGHSDNLKITRPEDLPLAEFYLRQQGRL